MAYENMMALGGLGAFFAAFFVFGLILMLAIYVYTSYAWMTILQKTGYHTPWLAWIPIANMVPLLEEGGFNWKWIFLVLVPFVGWLAVGVMAIIGVWKIFEKRNYPGWLSLVPLGSMIPLINWIASPATLIILGVVAWKDKN